MENNTIAAISTPNGAGGIGVIRISGDNAITIADKVFHSNSGKMLKTFKGYTAAFGHVVENNEIIDEAIALVFRTPHSYTGENLVELSCHGGMYITTQVLRAVLNAGAVTAQPGEFTKRAFINGKLDLAEAEAVMDIIGAKGKSAARAALACKDGSVSKKIDSVKDKLITQAAHLSAWADYPEDDIPAVSVENLRVSISSCLNEVEILLKNYDAGKIIKDGIDTLIIGKPNVGKSTLMNLLSGCERSIVTDIPGTTRDIIEETVMLGDVTLLLSDTAGLRDTDNPIEKIGVDKAKNRLKSCGLVLAVFDGTEELSDEDKKLLDKIADVPAVAIINKTDIDCKIDIDYVKNKIEHTILISAVNGTGVEKLEEAVSKITGVADFDPAVATVANERQRICAVNALCAIREALEALDIGMTLDAVTVSLEDGIQYLLELTGERASEVVVDNVFAKFCVGK